MEHENFMEPPQIECGEETERNPFGGTLDVVSESKQVAEEATPARRGRRAGSSGPPLVGSYVLKNFADGAGTLLGKVVSYGGRFFAAVYEDGRREELGPCEIRRMLVPDCPDEASQVDELGLRKRKLEEIVSAGRTSIRSTRRKVEASTPPIPPGIAANAEGSLSERRSGAISTVLMSGLAPEEDADSSTDSCESISAPDCTPTPSQRIPLQALPFPPSSGNIGIPEESVFSLFSVYNFLRSFSLQLFLSPFGLSDFVGSINCTVQNTLLDSIHVALLRALSRHLEVLSSDGSQVSSRCLKYFDWVMLDTLTWPVFLLEYLYLMGYTREQNWKGFDYGISDGEYYRLPATIKLRILQILCDAVVESDELRTELAIRENMDEEREYTSDVNIPPQVNMRTVHPRYSQTSACKDLEMLDNAISPEESTSSSSTLPMDANEPDVGQDGNSDECRLCGMDGTLICCDGCPSAYHSRCIGLTKAFLPDGPWFCPECTANKIGPTFSKIGAGIRGAEIFGTDPYGRVFLGSCNYLLVLETLLSVKPVFRYYNQYDVLKVLKLFCSAEQCSSLYADICKEIMKYWAISVDISHLEPERTHFAASQLVWKETFQEKKPFLASADKTIVNANVEVENDANNIAPATRENKTLANIDGDYMGVVVNDSLDSVNQADPPNTQKLSRESNDMSASKLSENANNILLVVKDNQFSSSYAGHAPPRVLSFAHEKLSEHIVNESAISFGMFSQPTDLADSNQQKSAEKSSMLDFEYCTSRNRNGTFGDDANSQVLILKDDRVSMSCESVQNNHIYGGKAREHANGSLILGSFFKPQAYVNQYVLGDVAAAAAANLAALALEESRSVVHASYNHRKFVSANIALQMKAFSRATMHFIWTCSEKKLMEAPRERCGWCIACKGASINKKGCLLNLAAANAIKGAVRGHGNHRSIKNGETHISAIATHILLMEENLHGLIFGSLADAKHNKQWHRLVKEASTCRALKFLLLELERNICSIAFSGDWFRLKEDWLVDFPPALVCTSVVAPTQKRGPGRRRKQPATSELITSSDHEGSDHVNWWRGGRVSRALFQTGILPSLLTKKAARQGGLKCVSGINYSENFGIPRRTHQFAWRAAVEMTKSASQLALQVRFLDAHIRWKDLVRPEQVPIEGKATESEASAFRNAVICEKQTTGNKIRYALTFGDQKRLPLRVMKNVLKAEAGQDGEEKLWFSESNVPLYLIKEYEEKAKDPLPCHKKVVPQCLPEFQRRQLRSCRKDIFSYLLHKEDKPGKCSCVSCNLDVLLRDAVRCNACLGYCHNTCLVLPSSSSTRVDSDCTPMCNKCSIAAFSALIKNQESTYSQLSFRQENQIDGKVEQRQYHPSLLFNLDVHSETKPPHPSESASEQRSKKGTNLSHGLIWRKKKSAETGEVFRLKHIIPRGGADGLSMRPICFLCGKDYNPDAMYICCERCSNWVHAEAVQLEEEQLLNLIGYKCCKCRRTKSPKCPYDDDPNYKKLEKKPLKERHAEETQGTVPLSVAWQATRLKLPNGVVALEDRHLPLSVKRIGSVTELPSEDNSLGSVAAAPQSPDLGGHYYVSPNGYDALPQGTTYPAVCCVAEQGNQMIVTPFSSTSLQGNVYVPGMEDGDPNQRIGEDTAGLTRVLRSQMLDAEEVNLEGMESEPPQTYFSFTELLASGDDQLDQLLDMPIDNILSDDWGDVQASTGGLDVDAGGDMGEPTSVLAGDGLPCQRCGISEPPADLTCEICRLCIHRGCSPWDVQADIVSSGATPWRCVSCRDWE